jgi:hypothetical protein
MLSGYFATFNRWSEINNGYEGSFMERVAPGSFTRTIVEDREAIKVLWNHGHDVLGNQILGRLVDLREDERGGAYRVQLYDGVPQLVLDGLRDGAYGSSFRFRVVRERVDEHPGGSTYNPRGLPERTILEAKLFELGPVSFPAYAGATAGVA